MKLRPLTLAALVPILASCSAMQPKVQEILSNERCVFFIDGKQAGAGKMLNVPLSPQEHEIACESDGYKPKMAYASPPFGGAPIRFTFMVEDKVDAPLSWENVTKIQDRQLLNDMRAGYEKYALRVEALEYDQQSRRGKVTVGKVTLEDYGRIKTYVEEVCQSKNKLLIAGQQDREKAGYLIEGEQASADAYTMSFRCVF